LKSVPAPTLMERYVLDTSFFLDLWKVDALFSKEIFVGIWEALEEGIATGAIIAPHSVADELRDTTDKVLKTWVSDHPDVFIPFDPSQLGAVTEIVRRFPGYAAEARNLADPQVVALGHIRGLAVLTSEKRVSTLGKNPKMPNVCESFSVEWLSIKGYCSAENIELHRALPQGSGV
jgi:hypothetical protein